MRDTLVCALHSNNFHYSSIEERMLTIQEKKKDLIAGAFRQSAEQQRSQRIRDIMEIFGI